MSTKQIIKRLYKDYISKYVLKIFLAAFFSVLVAISTSATAWLLDPAIEKLFLNKDSDVHCGESQFAMQRLKLNSIKSNL